MKALDSPEGVGLTGIILYCCLAIYCGSRFFDFRKNYPESMHLQDFKFLFLCTMSLWIVLDIVYYIYLWTEGRYVHTEVTCS
jgi:hypothetical protein